MEEEKLYHFDLEFDENIVEFSKNLLLQILDNIGSKIHYVEFYNSLKWLGIDTEMIVYPRTPHGPREPKFMMDVSQRIMTWFEKYRVN